MPIQHRIIERFSDTIELLTIYSELLDELLIDPSEAAAHINAALEDGDDDVLLIALRDVAYAHGFGKIADVPVSSIGLGKRMRGIER